MPVSSVKSPRLSPLASRGFQLAEQFLQLVKGRHPLVMTGDQIRELPGNLLTNHLVPGGLFGREPPLTHNTLHGRCLLGTS